MASPQAVLGAGLDRWQRLQRLDEDLFVIGEASGAHSVVAAPGATPTSDRWVTLVTRLEALGYLPRSEQAPLSWAEDPALHPQICDAIAVFQAEAGLVVDAQPGPLTWERLEQLSVVSRTVPLDALTDAEGKPRRALQRAIPHRLWLLGQRPSPPTEAGADAWREGLREVAALRERLDLPPPLASKGAPFWHPLVQVLFDHAGWVADLSRPATWPRVLERPHAAGRPARLARRVFFAAHAGQETGPLARLVLRISRLELSNLGLDVGSLGDADAEVRPQMQAVLQRFWELVHETTGDPQEADDRLTPATFRAMRQVVDASQPSPNADSAIQGMVEALEADPELAGQVQAVADAPSFRRRHLWRALGHSVRWLGRLLRQGVGDLLPALKRALRNAAEWAQVTIRHVVRWILRRGAALLGAARQATATLQSLFLGTTLRTESDAGPLSPVQIRMQAGQDVQVLVIAPMSLSALDQIQTRLTDYTKLVVQGAQLIGILLDVLGALLLLPGLGWMLFLTRLSRELWARARLPLESFLWDWPGD